jgi:hypothetical protein
MEEIGRGLTGDWPDKQVEKFPCACCRAAVRSPKSLMPWTERWRPFSFYETPYLVTGLSPLNLDELADLLGGRPSEAFLAEEATLSGAASRPLRNAWIGAPIGQPRGTLFSHDGSGMDALEALFLKVTAFRQVSQALLHFYRLTGKPHLDIHPRHVLFDLHGSGEGLPILWSFHARLHGLATASRSLPIEGAGTTVLPPQNPVVPYAPPEVIEFQLAGLRPAEVAFNDLVATAGEYRFHGRLTDPYGLFPFPQERDTILLTFQSESLGLNVDTLSVRVQDSSDSTATARAFVSEPVKLEEGAVRRAKRLFGVRLPGVRYRVYPDFGLPSDLYSLGVVLLRLLLANDEQDIQSVLRATTRVLASHDKAPITLGTSLKLILGRFPDLMDVFASANVFYSHVDRGPSRANAIPEQLWERVVLLALRLVGRVEGFSVCRDHSDFDPTYPASNLEWVLQEATLLCTELQSLLFSRQSVNVEVQQVLAEILLEESSNKLL